MGEGEKKLPRDTFAADVNGWDSTEVNWRFSPEYAAL